MALPWSAKHSVKFDRQVGFSSLHDSHPGIFDTRNQGVLDDREKCTVGFKNCQSTESWAGSKYPTIFSSEDLRCPNRSAVRVQLLLLFGRCFYSAVFLLIAHRKRLAPVLSSRALDSIGWGDSIVRSNDWIYQGPTFTQRWLEASGRAAE